MGAVAGRRRMEGGDTNGPEAFRAAVSPALAASAASGESVGQRKGDGVGGGGGGSGGRGRRRRRRGERQGMKGREGTDSMAAWVHVRRSRRGR